MEYKKGTSFKEVDKPDKNLRPAVSALTFNTKNHFPSGLSKEDQL